MLKYPGSTEVREGTAVGMVGAGEAGRYGNCSARRVALHHHDEAYPFVFLMIYNILVHRGKCSLQI